MLFANVPHDKPSGTFCIIRLMLEHSALCAWLLIQVFVGIRCSSMNADGALVKKMEQLRTTLKRSLTNEFLEKQASRSKRTKRSTRLEYARAKNRQDREFENVRKRKERISKILHKMREHEAAYDAANEDVDRLKNLLDEEEMV